MREPYSLLSKLPSGFRAEPGSRADLLRRPRAAARFALSAEPSPNTSRARSSALVFALGALVLCAAFPARAFDWIDPIERYAEALNSPNGSERLRAVQSLGTIESDAIEPLIIRALHDRQPGVATAAAQVAVQQRFVAAKAELTRWLTRPEATRRLAAAKALAKLGDEGCVKALTRSLQDPDAQIRLAVVNALAAVRSTTAVEPLLRRLDDPHSDVRTAILRALALLKDPRAVPHVMGKLSDPVPAVRGAAARTLGRLNDPRAAPSLVALLDDSNNGVVIAAVGALGRLRHALATPEIAALLDRPSTELREHVAVALARIGTLASVNALARALARPQLHDAIQRALRFAPPDIVARALRSVLEDPRTPRPALRAAVQLSASLKLSALQPLLVDLLERQRLPTPLMARALGGLADPRSQRTLLSLTDAPDPKTRLAAVQALPNVVDERARDVVRALVHDPYRPVRLAAVKLVGQLRDARAIGALARLVTGVDLEAARAAARALARIGQRRAVPILLRLLQHDDEEVRRVAVEALLNTTDPPATGELIRTCRALWGNARADCLQAFGSVLRARPHAGAALSFLRRELGRDDEAVGAAVISVLSSPSVSPSARIPTEMIDSLSASLRAQALDALVASREHSRRGTTRLLRASLDARDAAVRAAAAWAVGTLGLHELATSVRRLVTTQLWAARINAVATLVRLGDPADCSLFRLLLGDHDPYVRANAALGIGRCPHTLSSRRLGDRLSDEPCPWARLNLIRTLAHREAESQPDAKQPDTTQQRRGILRAVVETDPDPRVRASVRRLLHADATSKKRWIGFYLLDEGGQPLRDSPIALVLPSGLVKATKTDVRAQHWEQNLTPGYCYIERPGPS